MPYAIEILDSSLNPITRIPAPVPIDKQGNWLTFGERLSNPGSCKFRIATKEPLFTRYGNIVQPWANHVRIYEDTNIVWQGVIVDNPVRNRKYIEVLAKTYLFYLSKKRIVHDPEVVAGDGKNDYKAFSSGTLATAVTTLINDAKGKAGTNSLLANMAVGTIDNPNFPNGFSKTDGTPLAGAWTFSTNLTLQFSYVDTLKVLTQLGIYSNCDFEVKLSGGQLTFNWRSNMGTAHPELVFEYNQYGAVEDFNSPLYGSKMANILMGVAADNNGNIVHVEKSLDSSVQLYGPLDDVAGFSDVKDKNAILARLVQELALSATPDAEIQLQLNDRAYPIGMYQIGDTVTVKIVLGPISTTQLRRVIGYDILVGGTGRKKIHLFTNKPKEV